MLKFLVLAVAVTAVRASHFGSFEGHGLGGHPKLISQSVHLNEVPTKIIKVTKTVAIKVPVPYPVKVPHHIPVPVPVNHPVAVPVPQIVKVPEHVPVEVEKPVPVEVQQQVPVVVSKPVPLPQPVPVPHPVTVHKPIFYPVPHPIPYHSEGDPGEGYSTGGGDEHAAHESHRYSVYTIHAPGGGYEHAGPSASSNHDFQPSQPDYTSQH